MTGVTGLLVAIAAAAGLGLFYHSQSSHVAATGYEIQDLQARVAELRAQQQQLILQVSHARSPSVIAEAAGELGLVPLSPNAVRFAPTSTDSPD